MWLICGAALGRGKNKLLVRGVAGAEWAFCPSIRSTKRDRVSIGHCRDCRHFIRFEQVYVPKRHATREAVPLNTMTLKSSFNVAGRLRKPGATRSFALLHHIPSLTDKRQPPIDVFEEEDYLVVLTELRGIDEKDVNIEADENSVTITAQNAARRYFRIVRLPTGINKDTAEFTCRNNILQLRLRKLREKAQSGQH